MINNVRAQMKLIVVRGVVTIKCEPIIGVVKAQVSFTVSAVTFIERRPKRIYVVPLFTSLLTE